MTNNKQIQRPKRELTETEKRRRYAARKKAALKKRRKKLVARLIVVLLIIALVIAAIITISAKSEKSVKEKAKQTEQTEETSQTTTEPPVKEISLLAVGDVIGHGMILDLANTGDGYDFSSLFAPLKSEISKADIAVVNMETPFGGEDVGPYVGYPSFNTPDEMGLSLIDAGFDVVQLASNHSMDTGVQGLLHEMVFWKSHTNEITTIGLNASEEEKQNIVFVNKDGIKIAFLNYTYGLNGYELPDEYSYLLTLLSDENKDFIKEQIKKADEEADIVAIFPHWGEEYLVGEPNDFQKEWAELFTEAGADLIIGTHPHVVENVEWIEAGGNKALCYYSLGNFVSNQQETETVLGVMAYLKIKSDATGVYVDEKSASVIPIVTHNDKTGETVKIETYYLNDYTDEFAQVHDTKLSYDEDFSVEKLNGIINDVFDASMIKKRVD